MIIIINNNSSSIGIIIILFQLPGWYSGNNSGQDPPSWLKVLQSHAEFKGLDRPALDVNVFEHMKQISGPPLSRHVVYRARYRGKPVALKHYSLEGPHEYTNLLREAETLQRLAACPYIADVEFVFQVFGKLEAYLVMPFYTGGTLDALQFDQGSNFYFTF
jgi:serine/threonine protein kinase